MCETGCQTLSRGVKLSREQAAGKPVSPPLIDKPRFQPPLPTTTAPTQSNISPVESPPPTTTIENSQLLKQQSPQPNSQLLKQQSPQPTPPPPPSDHLQTVPPPSQITEDSCKPPIHQLPSDPSTREFLSSNYTKDTSPSRAQHHPPPSNTPTRPLPKFVQGFVSLLGPKSLDITSSVLLTVQLKIDDHEVDALIDCGATHNFLSNDFASLNSMQTTILDAQSSLHLDFAGKSNSSVCNQAILGAHLSDGNLFHSTESFHVADLRHDMILGLPWLQKHNPTICWKTNTIRIRHDNSKEILWRTTKHPLHRLDNGKTEPYSINFITTRQFHSEMKQKHNPAECFTVHVRSPKEKPCPKSDHEASIQEKVKKLILKFKEVFPIRPPTKLPPERDIDHAIDLKPGSKPHAQKPFRLSQSERDEVYKTITQLLLQGFIRPSTSPWAAPVLFAKKKDGSLRFCIDYRALNRMTIRNMFPIPRPDDLIEKTSGAKVFSIIDLWSAYQQVLMKKDDIPKTGFVTPFGHFEYLVLPFGLTNAPATFQSMMNKLLDHLPYVSVYLDDILVFSDNDEDHLTHLQKVLCILRDNKLYAKSTKCDFFRQEVEFVGFIISEQGLKPEKSKVQAIVDWPTPSNIKELQCFLGFANFYRRFIPKFSSIGHPLYNLLKKDTNFFWSEQCSSSFQDLKDLLTTSPTLRIFDPSRPVRIKADASGQSIGAELSQYYSDEDEWHPIAFLSRTMQDAELHYHIGEQELLALIFATQKWRHYLFGSSFIAYTDHAPLVTLMTSKKLSGRKMRWAQILDEFDVSIVYRPGTANIVADSLSRKPPSPFSPYNLLAEVDAISSTSTPSVTHQLLEQIPELYVNDSLFSPIVEFFKEREINPDLIPPRKIASVLSWYTWDNQQRQLFYSRDNERRLCIPRCADLIKFILSESHNLPTAGHSGVNKMHLSLLKQFYWPRMKSDIIHFIQHCDPCQRNKTSNLKGQALLKPLDTPSTPWESVSMDFITGLVESNGCDAILVVVDRFTKMVHFIPVHTTDTAVKVARTFFREVVRLHGLPASIVSDRDPKFVSSFWKELFKILDTNLLMSTARHPQTDGQTEIMNRYLEVMVRHYIRPSLNNWATLLPSLEFAFNDSVNSTTKQTPFFLNYGFQPRTPLSIATHKTNEIQTTRVEATSIFIENMESNRADALDAITLAQTLQAQYANVNRREFPNYQIGDQVLLSSKGFPTRFRAKNAHKFQSPFIGPFKVAKVISNVNYELELPPSMRIHPVFYVGLLKSYFPPLDPILPPPPVVHAPGEPAEYEVEAIIRHRRIRNREEYLVKWKGYLDHDNTWEPETNLTNCPDILNEFKSTLRQHQPPNEK